MISGVSCDLSWKALVAQELAKQFIADRMSRLESVVEHAAKIMEAARDLLHNELRDVKRVREQMGM